MLNKVAFGKEEIYRIIAEETARNRSSNVWAIYARKSRYDPHNPGYSMEIQPDRSEEYARANGAKEIKYFDDAGRSGKNSNRAGLQKLIFEVKAGKIDVVVFHRLDRVFRNLKSLLEFVHLLQSYKVRFVSVTEQLDTHTWWGRLVMVVLGSLAEAYVWQASDNTREGLAKHRSKGLHLGRIPFGYCNGLCSTCNDENGKGYCPLFGGPDRSESKRGQVAVPHPVDLHAILLIFQWYLSGMSFREIAGLLNNNRMTLPDGSEVLFRPRGKRGTMATVNPVPVRNGETPKRFSRESIRAILENPFYTGQVARYRRPQFSLEDDLEHPEKISNPKIEGNSREVLELFPGQHEPLISFETWQAVTALRKGKGSTPARLDRPARIYPLSGVARCWECFEMLGKEFTLRGSLGGKGIIYYRCAYLHDHCLKRKRKRAPRVEGVNPVVNSVDQELAERHKNLRADKIEAQVDRLISKLIVPREWDDWIAAYYLSKDGMAEFERAGYRHRQELQQIRDLFTAGHIALPEFERKTRILQEKLNSLKPASRSDAGNLVKEIRPFAEVWRKLTNIEKRQLLDMIFAGLYFDREGRLIRADAYEPFRQLLNLPDDGMLVES